jgi:hypothetical protein
LRQDNWTEPKPPFRFSSFTSDRPECAPGTQPQPSVSANRELRNPQIAGRHNPAALRIAK